MPHTSLKFSEDTETDQGMYALTGTFAWVLSGLLAAIQGLLQEWMTQQGPALHDKHTGLHVFSWQDRHTVITWPCADLCFNVIVPALHIRQDCVPSAGQTKARCLPGQLTLQLCCHVVMLALHVGHLAPYLRQQRILLYLHLPYDRVFCLHWLCGM